jgi:hypothetical protein
LSAGQQLISFRESAPQFNDISTLLLDLSDLVPILASRFLSGPSDPARKLLAMAAFTPQRQGRPNGMDRHVRRQGTNLQQPSPLTPPGVTGPARRDSRESSRSPGEQRPRYLGRVPTHSNDDVDCWHCAGLLKTARRYYAATADPLASAQDVNTATHPFLACPRFSLDMLGLAKGFLQPARRQVSFVSSLVDFETLPSDDCGSASSAEEDDTPLNS